MVAHLLPTSEVCGSNPRHLGGSNPRSYVVKLLTGGWQFTVLILDQLYVLFSSSPPNHPSWYYLYSIESHVKTHKSLNKQLAVLRNKMSLFQSKISPFYPLPIPGGSNYGVKSQYCVYCLYLLHACFLNLQTECIEW